MYLRPNTSTIDSSKLFHSILDICFGERRQCNSKFTRFITTRRLFSKTYLHNFVKIFKSEFCSFHGCTRPVLYASKYLKKWHKVSSNYRFVSSLFASTRVLIDCEVY